MNSTELSRVYVLFLLVIATGSHVWAKRYLRCELARKLLDQHGFERSLLSNWICLLEHESELDTAKVTVNPNGSKNYGLFQINGRYCQQGRRGGICNVNCDDLLDENIQEAAVCAKRIQTSDGFRHWNGWQRYCRNTQNLPNLKVICGI
ncbi:lysozyme [Drosophila tropicalis]|uniref:lysozyme n=1 Tax=Drosophila tropicalis TaxID=46794 RepID=UPI0035AB703A